MTRYTSSEVGQSLPPGETSQRAEADWGQPTESQTYLLDRLDWQDILHYVDPGSTIAGDAALSWTSPGDILGDVKKPNDSRGEPDSNLEEASERRRAQNRASQRAYRERRDRHVKCLEEKLEDMVGQHELLAKEHTLLRAEHEKILKNSTGWKTEVVDVQGTRPSYVPPGNKSTRDKELLVKVMICKKDCENRSFLEDD